MTLIEVILSIGILAAVFIITIGYLLENVRRNRQMSMEVAGLQAINEIVGVIDDLADSTSRDGVLAHTIVKYFDDMSGERIAIGPDGTDVDRIEIIPAEGCLLYRFWIAEPGRPRFAEDDSRFKPYRGAVGEMRIFLDETILNDRILSAASWTDLSSEPVSAEDGMDLDLNGSKTDNHLNDYKDVRQLALSFLVTFYRDEKHKDVVYSCSRDILMARIRNRSDGL